MALIVVLVVAALVLVPASEPGAVAIDPKLNPVVGFTILKLESILSFLPETEVTSDVVRLPEVILETV